MSGNAVLVTGAGGFIGSHLTETLLENGRSVRALDLNLDRHPTSAEQTSS